MSVFEKVLKKWFVKALVVAERRRSPLKLVVVMESTLTANCVLGVAAEAVLLVRETVAAHY